MRLPMLPRRALVGVVLSAGLVSAGLAAVAADATAGCSFTDPAGDSTLGAPGSGDDDLDITTVGVSAADNVLTAAVKLVKLTDFGPTNYPGDDFEFAFTMNKKAFLLGAFRDFNPTGDPDVTPYVYVNDTKATAPSLKPKYDLAASTFSISISFGDLDKLAGTSSAGAVLSGLKETAYANFNGPEQPADTAAPKDASTTYTIGEGACGGAAPAPSATASTSGTPSATASASASGTASASSSSTASGSASASPGGVAGPAPGCVTYTDPKGDGNAAIGPVPFGNDPDLDILSVTFRTTPDVLSAYIKVDKLAAKPSSPQFSGHKFDFGFTHNGKALVLTASGTGTGTGTVGGTANADLKPKAVFDIPSSQVILSIDRPSVEKASGAPLPDGMVITKTSAHSIAVIPTSGQTVADTAVGATPEQQTYTIGDNKCFPATGSSGSAGGSQLAVSAPARVQSSDVEVVTATLKGSNGEPLAGKRVTAQVGTGPVVAGTTGSSGQVRLAARVSDRAGQRVLSVRYAGDASGAGAAQVRKTVTVVAEVSKIATASSGSGALHTFTITLTDDDTPTRHPYVGATVTFAYSGKTVQVSTNRYGKASVQAKPGAHIDVRYAGRPGYVSAATARTVVR